MKKYCLLFICLLSANLLPAQWIQLPPITANNLTDIDFSGPITGVAVGENGSVFKTVDGGLNWEFISPEKDITYTSVDLTSPADYFVSGFKTFPDGSGITKLFFTDDAGKTWRTINSYGEVGEPSQVRCNERTIYFLSAWKGLQRSLDGGREWELVFKGGGTTVLSNLITDRFNPESTFVFGNVGGFATYSSIFRHSADGSPWDLPDPFDFDNVAAYTAFDVINDTLLLFRNFYNRFMPNDTSNILSAVYDFKRDDIIPGGNTGDTSWHFKIKTVNDRIPHYVNDCHFFTVTGLGFSVENVGGINRTEDGGVTWNQVYSGRDTLNAICMVSDTLGYVVGSNGTLVKMGSTGATVPGYPDNGLMVNIYPSPATDRIIVETSNPGTPTSLVVTNTSGRIMMTMQINRSSTQVDIGTWPKGIYFFSVQQKGKSVIKKIIRE